MENSSDFTSGKILPALIKFALPVLFAVFLQTMYGAVDMLIVGQFGTAADVSAVSTGSWIMQTITSAIVGIAMGTTILIGQRIGEQKNNEIGNIIGASIYMFFVFSVIVTVVVELIAPFIAGWMRAPKEAFAGTVTYIRVCSAGSVFIVAYNVLGSIFRGLGNSKIPLMTVTIACVVNIIGDLVLVGGLGMGVTGAAIATVIAQMLSVVLSLVVIRKMSLPFEFSLKNIKCNLNIIKDVIKLGTPIAFQDVLVTISFLVISAIVNTLGVVPSAGVGVAQKICGFVLLVPSAYMQSMSAFVAQNIGAGQYARARRALVCAIGTSLGVGVFLTYISFFHGDILSGIFSSDPEVVFAASEYLKSYAVDCMLVSFLFSFIGYFNGCRKTLFVMSQGIIGAFCIRVPVSYFMSRVEPVSLFKIGLATPASTIVQIVLCLIFFFVVYRKDLLKK